MLYRFHAFDFDPAIFLGVGPGVEGGAIAIFRPVHALRFLAG
jgi:hypothetical protein